MKKLTPLALILVLLGSGCTVPILNIQIPGLPDIPGFGGPTVVQYEHDIIIIESLQAIPAEIDAGQTTKLVAYIKNIGDKTIDKTVTVNLYDYCQGLFKTPKVMCGGQETSSTKCEIGKMLPSEIVRISWTLEQDDNNPVKLRTVCPPDGMKVSVEYDYTTTGLSTISFISKAELERTLEERKQMSTNSYIVMGQGPIKPFLTVQDKQPVPVYKDARTMLQLVIKNMGSGQLNSKFTEANTEFVGLPKGSSIEVVGIGGSSDLKPLSSAQSDCKIEGKVQENVRLIGKESPPLQCRIDLSNLDGRITKTGTRHLEVTVNYKYMFTKSVNVVVNPKFTA
jgi:archaellum component FlaG (FlaF/FlaG flagellin family)